MLNIHLGLKGLYGARLFVKGEEYKWSPGKVIPWDGSFDHSVDCVHCAEDRYIFMVRYQHPDLTAAHFAGYTKTHFEDIPPEITNLKPLRRREEL